MSDVKVPHSVQREVDRAVFNMLTSQFPRELLGAFDANDDAMLSEAYYRTLRKIRRTLNIKSDD